MTDDVADFVASLQLGGPLSSTTMPLRAVWHGLRGEWDSAHEIVQAGNDRESAWVHAWLHRIEGDFPNARYWYGRAGKEMPAGTVQEEGLTIAASLIKRSTREKP